MQEPIKEDKTPDPGKIHVGRQMETSRLDDSWVITDRIPALAGDNTINVFNWLIENKLATFILYINGAGHREVTKFIGMADRYFVTAICKDKLSDVSLEFVVPHYTTFGVFLNSDTYYLRP